MAWRAALFIVTALAVFLFFNGVTCRALWRIHPRRHRSIVALAVLGNLMWLFFPFQGMANGFSRLTRSLFGPAWFAWNSFAIVYAALLLLIALAWLPFRRSKPFPQFAHWPSRVFLTLTLAGSVIGFYHALVPLRVERVPVAIRDLPPDAEGMRIALLGDLHVGLFSRRSRLAKIFGTTRALRPDVILLAGDLIDDDPHFTPKLLEVTRSLDPDTPLLAVLGNHEMYGDPKRVVEQLRGSRIRLLINEGMPLRGLWIAGTSDIAAASANFGKPIAGLTPDVRAALSKRPPGSVPILFAHQPRVFEEARRHRVPLTLVAHTHGGQLGFRPLRLSLAGVFLPFHMGLYRRHGSQLYVNTGTGFWLVPFRLGMTPEITLIELRAE